MNPALLSSRLHTWRTPKYVLTVVEQVAPISLDPFASDNPRHWFADENWCLENQDMPSPARSRGLAFLNPPYGSFLTQSRGYFVQAWYPHSCKELITLLPNRPGSQWYSHLFGTCDAYCFWMGRIAFVKPLQSIRRALQRRKRTEVSFTELVKRRHDPAPFPSVFFYFGPNKKHFCDVFSQYGDVSYFVKSYL